MIRVEVGRWVLCFRSEKEARDYISKLEQEAASAASAAEQVSDEAILAGELDRPGGPPTAPPVSQEELARAGHFDRPGS